MSTQELFDAGNTKFRTLLRAFDKVIEGKPDLEEIKDTLDELKATAAASGDLTSRQVDAIAGRCDNYMNGTYGNTKKPEHYDHGKPSK